MNILNILRTDPTHPQRKALLRPLAAPHRQWLKVRDRRNWRKRPLKNCGGEV